jgi:hypothetical protein
MKKLVPFLIGLMFCITVSGLNPRRALSQSDQEIDKRIPKGAKIYVAPLENGYHIYLTAAMIKKEVPVTMVTDREKADFELSAVTESEKAGWAKMLFQKSGASAEQASIQVVNIKTSTIVFGYNVNKSNSARGKQSSSEACAKHIKEKIESGK